MDFQEVSIKQQLYSGWKHYHSADVFGAGLVYRSSGLNYLDTSREKHQQRKIHRILAAPQSWTVFCWFFILLWLTQHSGNPRTAALPERSQASGLFQRRACIQTSSHPKVMIHLRYTVLHSHLCLLPWSSFYWLLALKRLQKTEPIHVLFRCATPCLPSGRRDSWKPACFNYFVVSNNSPSQNHFKVLKSHLITCH